ncbi:MAG: FesM [Anaerolineae bacterium]|jgi:polyferredoxin|nr:FesM [Anaerolineae bacterium]
MKTDIGLQTSGPDRDPGPGPRLAPGAAGLSGVLRWRHLRTALQVPLFLVALLMVGDGLAGPQLAPRNLATVGVWVHYRGLVVLALLLAGNLFCLACPFMLVRNAGRHLFRPTRLWPRRLRNKWLAVGLFAGLLFAYELFDLWASPRWTAWLIVAYFAGALVADSLFRGANFCKYLCPLGQFNFCSSLVSPLEVRIRSHETCAQCPTKDCIRGSPPARDPALEAAASAPGTAPLPGCQLWLYQPAKFGNMDCTFCLDCVRACPYDNVTVAPRLPGAELWQDPRRSGIGRFSQRADLAVLAVVFTFGALLNAFAMVSPVYALEDWLAGVLNTTRELPVLALIFSGGLVVLPALLLLPAGWLSLRWSRAKGGFARGGLRTWIVRFSYALVPLGLGVWLAHYSFHFLTGFWTWVPVLQSFVADLAGTPLLGAPRWSLGPLLPSAFLYPLEIGFLGLGWFGSLLAAHRIAGGRVRAWLPWAVVLSLLFAAAVWLMGQPMEMRGTFLVG